MLFDCNCLPFFVSCSMKSSFDKFYDTPILHFGAVLVPRLILALTRIVACITRHCIAGTVTLSLLQMPLYFSFSAVQILGYCLHINGCCFNMHRTWILCAHWISLLIIIFGAAIHPSGSYTWPIHWTKVVLWSMTASLGICFRTNCGRCTFWGFLTIAWVGSCKVWHGNPVRACCHLGCQFYHRMDHAILIHVSILLQPFIYWSPIFLSGASTIEDCEAQVVQLELILDAKVLSFSSQNFFSFEFIEFF